MDETQAIARLKRGDLTGLETLVKLYQVQAVRSAYLILGERAAAEDIAQAAFLRLVEKIGQYDERRTFRPWFLRSVIHAAIKAAERGRRQVSLDDSLPGGTAALEELIADSTPPPGDLVERRELRRQVWEALQRLTPNERAAIVMRYYLGMSEREAAEELDRPLTTVKWWLHSARVRLRSLLQPLHTAAPDALEDRGQE